MTKKQRKTLLLGLLFQLPLIVALQNGVRFLTGLSLLWCVPITIILIMIYNAGEKIMWGEK